MSHSGKSLHEMDLDSLTDRLQDSFTFEQNKPDSKQNRLNSHTSSSIPRYIVSPKTPSNTGGPKNHSGELGKPRSGEKTHRRSSSTGAPLIYSGRSPTSSGTSTSSSTSTGGSGGVSNFTSSVSSVSSPNSNLYPSGNICPSGKILKSNMGSRVSNRSEKLGSGTVNYGHGSIMKGGGGKVEGNVRGNAQCGGEDRAVVKRGMVSCDPEEVKNEGNELYRRGNFCEALVLYDRAIGMSPENAAYRSNRAAALTMLGRLGEAVRECEEAVRLNSGYLRAHQRLASLYLRLVSLEMNLSF